MINEAWQGQILYTSKQESRLDAERGREFFSLIHQGDGISVLHAHSEIDDAPQVVRDVMLAVNADGSPVDCSVRLTVGGQFEGSGWMTFDGHDASCESINRHHGRISQTMKFESRPRWLQAHPVFGDGLLMKLYDLSQGPGELFFSDIALTSPDHRGATGPQLYKTGFGIRYLGEEDIEVVAGKFRARHFQVIGTAGNLPEEHPPYDIWTSADERYLFLRASAGGYMQTHYELKCLSSLY